MAVNTGSVTHHDWVVTCGTDQRESATAGNVTQCYKQMGPAAELSSVVLLCGSMSIFRTHERHVCVT